MKRGDIYFANLDPTVCAEVQKNRPVLIISNDANNIAASIVTVLPLTSNTNKIYHFEILLETTQSNLTKKSKVLCNQIRTISKLRLKNKIGFINDETMNLVEEALKIHLGF